MAIDWINCTIRSFNSLCVHYALFGSYSSFSVIIATVPAYLFLIFAYQLLPYFRVTIICAFIASCYFIATASPLPIHYPRLSYLSFAGECSVPLSAPLFQIARAMSIRRVHKDDTT